MPPPAPPPPRGVDSGAPRAGPPPRRAALPPAVRGGGPQKPRGYATGKSRRLPADIQRRAAMRLTQLDAATTIEDLRLPPSNRLEALRHDCSGQWSIRINQQWRICFRFERRDALDVEIVDYH
ncbi:type II toxin-antitoxin system RelE/ParE family toxin [Candidatus Amarolinea dominans]|uniref:type II toxin-antitoxin system RelE/ParE family toxin n=1 Tax=Candidatus Amarolinea dominans TaxID=3140696 RepID=UPI0031CC6318